MRSTKPESIENLNSMKTIIIITNGTLPVPPVNGGAVENLIQTFLDINETTNDFKFIVFSVSNTKALSLSIAYKNTQYIFIESETIFYKIGRAVRFIINKLRDNTISNQFIYEILKYKKIFLSTDMVLIENNPSYSSYIRKITNKPIGLHLHNDYLNIDTKIWSSKVLCNLNFVVGVSNYIKNRVSEIAPDHCKVDFVYNGMNLNRFGSPDPIIDNKIFTKKYGIEDDEIVILFAGRLQETKGIKLLIEAFIDISEIYNAKLLIVGSSGFRGSKKNKFIKQLEELSRAVVNKIIFTGYIEYSEIHHIYNLADFAVFPSLSPEAFPLTTIEALASGLPVIITDVGGMPETVNEKCGIVIRTGAEIKEELKKEMVKLIVDSKLRKKMSIEAKKHARNFNEHTYFQSLSSVLKSFL